jgi:hypothetical protein
MKLSAGDLFRFAGPRNAWGCGQILFSKILQYIVVFEPRFIDTAQPSLIVSSRPLLAGWTMDGRFYTGQWEVVGHCDPIDNIRFPFFKVGISGRTWVTDWLGKPLRYASLDEEQQLTFKKSYSPIIFEDAFNAYHGDLPWESRFDAMRAQLNCGDNPTIAV